MVLQAPEGHCQLRGRGLCLCPGSHPPGLLVPGKRPNRSGPLAVAAPPLHWLGVRVSVEAGYPVYTLPWPRKHHMAPVPLVQAPHGPGSWIQNSLCLCSSISASGSPQGGSLALLYPGSWVQAAGVLDSGPDPACLSLAFPRQGRGSRAADTARSRLHQQPPEQSRPAWTLPVLPGAGGGPASRGSWSQAPRGWLGAHGGAPGNAGSSSFSARPLPCAPSRERLQVTHLPGTSQGPWAAGQEHGGRPVQKERREAPGLGGPDAAHGHPAAKWET